MADFGLTTPQVPTTVKNQELVQKRREQIVLAAIKLFSKKGFHKTTLRELADEVGISHGNIYDYVGNKEDIFFLIHEFMANLADVSLIKTMEETDDPLEKLRRMVRSEFNLMYEWADAILLIYQESNILKNALLKKFLQREREHIARFELVLKECVEEKICRYLNYRVIANLIKIMTDSWVLKRWDLRYQVTQIEMEEYILDLIFHGILQGKEAEPAKAQQSQPLSGKTAFVLNGGTILGRAASRFLGSKGAKISICGKGLEDELNIEGDVSVFPIKSYKDVSTPVFGRILNELGTIDIFVVDLSTSITKMPLDHNDGASGSRKLEKHFSICQDLILPLREKMKKQSSGRIIFLAPWAWDRLIDPLHYQTVRAGLITVTKTLARELAPCHTTVNCIVPGFIKGSRPFPLEIKYASEFSKEIPMGLLGEIRDVVEAIYFLVSDSSKYITGQVLGVNGGIDD